MGSDITIKNHTILVHREWTVSMEFQKAELLNWTNQAAQWREVRWVSVLIQELRKQIRGPQQQGGVEFGEKGVAMVFPTERTQDGEWKAQIWLTQRSLKGKSRKWVTGSPSPEHRGRLPKANGSGSTWKGRNNHSHRQWGWFSFLWVFLHLPRR